MDAELHWQQVYEERAPDQVSWFEATPERSLALAFPLAFYSTSMTPIGRVTVGAGTHSLDLDVRNQEAGDIAVEERSIMTQFIPN